MKVSKACVLLLYVGMIAPCAGCAAERNTRTVPLSGCASKRVPDVHYVSWIVGACAKFNDRTYRCEDSLFAAQLRSLNANTIIHEKVYLLEGAISVARDKSVPRAVRATVLASLLESHDRSVRFSAWEGLLMILDSQDAYANVSSWENVVLKGKDRGTGKGIKKLLGFISSHRTSINDADDGPWHLGQRKHRD